MFATELSRGSRTRVGPQATFDRGQLLDRLREPRAYVVIGDPSDGPTQPDKFSVAALVRLRVEPPTVPRDVVDLDSELSDRIGQVEVHRPTTVEHHSNLTLELDPRIAQRSPHAQLEVGVHRAEPARSGIEHSPEAHRSGTPGRGEATGCTSSRRDGQEFAIEHLLEYRLESGVVEVPGKIAEQPERPEYGEAAEPADVGPVEEISSVRVHAIEANRPTSDEVDIVGVHSTESPEAAGRRPRQRGVGRGEQRRLTTLLEVLSVRGDAVHAAVHRDKGPSVHRLRPETTDVLLAFEVVCCEETTSVSSERYQRAG